MNKAPLGPPASEGFLASPAPPLAGAGPSQPPASLPPASLPNPLAQIEAYQNQALNLPDPLQANVGYLAGNLMKMADQVVKGQEACPVQGLTPQDALEEIHHRADQYLKVVRTIERLARFQQLTGNLIKALPPAERPAGSPR